MTPRETFESAVRKAFRLNLRLDETLERILAAGDEYAAAEAERIAHPPYKPARKIDLGQEKAKRAKERSDEKEPA